MAFQVYTSVKVIDEKLEAFGHVGSVISDDGKTVTVKIDGDEDFTEFKPEQVQGV